MGDWPQAFEPGNLATLSAFNRELAYRVRENSLASLASTAWPANNRGYGIQIPVYKPEIVTRLAINNGATVSGNFDAGIYDDQGNLIVSTGSTAQAGTSQIQDVNVTDTLLLPGVYYLWEVHSTTVATVVAAASASTGNYRTGSSGLVMAATVLPLPSTITPVVITAASLHVIPTTTALLAPRSSF